MEYNLSKNFARIGGALILIGLVLPWYKFDLGQVAQAFGGTGGGELKIDGFPTSQSFNSWEGGWTVVLIVGAFGTLALSQIPFATPGIVGRFFMVAGFAGFVLLGYKIMNPPFDDVLSLLKMSLKPQPGIFVALAGMAFATYGGWEQVKVDLRRPAYQPQTLGSDWHTTGTADPANQRYAQPQFVSQTPAPQGYPAAQAVAAQQPQPGQPQAAGQPVAAPRVIPPDPFAPKPPTAL